MSKTVWTLDLQRNRHDGDYTDRLLAWCEQQGIAADRIAVSELLIPSVTAEDDTGRLVFHGWQIAPPDDWKPEKPGDLPPSALCEHQCCGQDHVRREPATYVVTALPPA